MAQLYLARFGNDDGLLWQYERGKHKAVLVQPKDAAVESYLYAPEVGDDPKNDSVEVFLAEFVESPAARPLERLINGAELTTEDLEALSLYLAIQELRVPERRDWVNRFIEDLAHRVMDLEVAHPSSFRRRLELATGRDYTEEDVQRFIDTYQKNGLQVRASKISWLDCLLKVSRSLAPTISRLKWLVVEVAEEATFEFVTSDRPVTKVLTDRTLPASYAGGWESPSAESTLTLTPKHVLVITPAGRSGRVHIGARNPKAMQWLENVNARTVGQAHRFVFSRTQQDFIPGSFSGERR